MLDPIDFHGWHRRRATGAVRAVEPNDGRRTEGRLTALVLGNEFGSNRSRNLDTLRSHVGELSIDLGLGLSDFPAQAGDHLVD